MVLLCREGVGQFSFLVPQFLFEALFPHQAILDIGQFAFELAESVGGQIAGANPLLNIYGERIAALPLLRGHSQLELDVGQFSPQPCDPLLLDLRTAHHQLGADRPTGRLRQIRS